MPKDFAAIASKEEKQGRIGLRHVAVALALAALFSTLLTPVVAWKPSSLNSFRWVSGDSAKAVGNDPPGPDAGLPGKRTILVFIDDPWVTAPPGAVTMVEEGMAAWNAALTFHGAPRLVRTAVKTDADIHVQWGTVGAAYGETFAYALDGTAGFGATQKTVKINIQHFEEGPEETNQVQTLGIKSTAMHEFGHALGLGHSALSLLMADMERNQEERAAHGVYARPQKDDAFGLEWQYQVTGVLIGQVLPQPPEPNIGNAMDYTIRIEASTFCGSGSCSESISQVVFEIPDEVIDEGSFTAPIGWAGAFVDARQPASSQGAEEHEGPRRHSLIVFASSPASRIHPGGFAEFVISATCERLGLAVRAFFSSIDHTGGGETASFNVHAPCVPRDLVATASGGNVNLDWSAPSSDGWSAITGYKVYHSSVAGGPYTLLASLGNQLTYSDTTVPLGASRCYVVAAVNAVGEGALASEACAQVLPACSDGIDNDGDGATDAPADEGCSDAADNNETSQCADGANNDGDGWTDYPDDAGCTSAIDNTEAPNPQCKDAVDNDADSWADFPADPGCTSSYDDSEAPNPQCSDGINNDGDAWTDYPDDPGCTGNGDNSELDASSSGGSVGGVVLRLDPLVGAPAGLQALSLLPMLGTVAAVAWLRRAVKPLEAKLQHRFSESTME